MKNLSIEHLIGKTLSNVENTRHEIIFTELSEPSRRYALKHEQDCCESVHVEDVVGDLSDLTGSPIVMAEEVSGTQEVHEADAPLFDGQLSDEDEYYEWTYYRLGTIKGTVSIRFYGTSNGYYSTSVSFVELS